MDKVRFSKKSIYENGYGIIAKKIMTDTRLSIEAKAIYSYLVSYAGAGETAFPSVDLILHHLQISKTRFYKYRNELIEYGYIIIEKEKKQGGKFPHNVYIILSEPCPQFKYMGNRDTGNEDTNNNSNNINNNNSNSNNLYVFLPKNENMIFLNFYLEKFEEHFGKNHMRVRRDQLIYITTCMEALEEEISEEEYRDVVEEYFNKLPKKNNGNVLAFLKATKRLFNVDLEEVT